jgi:hypothetical protein
MFMTKGKVATTSAMVTVLVFGGLYLRRDTSMQAGQDTPTQAPPSKGKDAKEPAEKIYVKFPDGLEHDFGKVYRGEQCRHAFRLVNRSKGPVHIDLRCS